MDCSARPRSQMSASVCHQAVGLTAVDGQNVALKSGLHHGDATRGTATQSENPALVLRRRERWARSGECRPRLDARGDVAPPPAQFGAKSNVKSLMMVKRRQKSPAPQERPSLSRLHCFRTANVAQRGLQSMNWLLPTTPPSTM